MVSLLKNDEAVSELIGAILLVGIAVIFLGTIQVYQVPEWNEVIEHQHMDIVYDDFLKLKTNIEDSAIHGFPKTSIIHMGASYPNRVVLRNPGWGTAGMLLIEPDKWVRINYTTQGDLTLFDEYYEAGAVPLISYNGVYGSQHSTPTNMQVQSTIKHNGTYALEINGNDWREQTLPSLTLTSDTNMSVWIRGDEETEIQAIGVAYGTGGSRRSLLYKLWGTQGDISSNNWINSRYQDMYTLDGIWHRYEFPIGTDWYDNWGSYEDIDRIVYIQDSDGVSSPLGSGLMYIDDIEITNISLINTSTNYTSSTISFYPGYNYYHNAPTMVYEHGLAIKDFTLNNFSYTDTPQSIVDEDSVILVWTNSTESSFGSAEPKALIAKYIKDSSFSTEGSNVSLTIHTSFPELWNNSLSDIDNIAVSINGNDVTVTYPSDETIDILAKGSEITFTRGVSTIATPTPTPPPPDTTPPGSITNLMNSSYDYSYIRWVWNNPSDSDFSYTMIYVDGVWSANTSLQFYNAIGFSGDQSHTISTHTVDTSGNINTTWVNHTAQTRSTGYPNWWDPLWSCRRNVTVTNNVSSALTNYPVYLEIAHNSNMTNDFSDIRFATEDGSQELPYWIENKVDGTNATVWVKVPSMVASADTTIYIYYGNAGASSQSDGTGVMDWYDNFTGAHTLSDYTIEDVGSASAPSSWSINTGGGFLRQQSNIYYNGVANNIGSILKTGVDLSGFEVQMNIRPSDNDVSGIGFCYENSSSHYAFGFTNDYWFGSNTGSSRREI